MDKLKMSYLCFLVVLVGVSLPMAFGKQNLLIDGDFSAGDWSLNWTDYDDPTVTPVTPNTETLDSVENEAGKAPCLRIDIGARTSGQSNGHYFYQAVPVTPGKYYQWRGRWKGDLDAINTRRHWAEIMIGFGDGAVIEAPLGTSNIDIAFKRRFQGNNPSNAIPQEEPFMSDGQWDWEDMVSGAGDNFGYDDGMGAIAPAWATHAFFSINLGGSSTGSGDIAAGSVVIWLDDLGIMSCQGPGDNGTVYDISDLNMDCRTDIVDLAILSAAWLSCNLDPVDDGSLGTCF